MIAMQYEITLPADYDMDVIRNRVARTGHLLDSYPGLGLKAYLVREKGVDGSTVNQYAPFYLWADPAGAASFLWSGQGFTAIMRDFGRPAVRTWVGGTVHRGGGAARYALRTTVALAADADVVRSAAEADARMRQVAAQPGVYAAAYAIDPHDWELVTLVLQAEHPGGEEDGVTYRVLHLAAPEVDALPDQVHQRL